MNETFLLKIGGAKLQASADILALTGYVEELRRGGRSVVVVHGGGPEISELHARLDVPFLKRDGLRATMGESIHLTTMVLCGLTNKRVSAAFAAHNIPSLGICGADGGLLRAELLDEQRLGRVGGAPQVDTDGFSALLGLGRVPIVAPVSLGPDGGLVNVNADTAAHAIAAALKVVSLDFISDIPGVAGADGRVIERITPAQAEELIGAGVIRGGMVPKIKAAVEAVAHGVNSVRIGDLEAMRNETATRIS